MTRPNSLLLPGLLVLSILSVPFAGAEESSPEETAKHTLRYKFKAGETLRWQVVQRTLVKTTVSGFTDSAEMVSKSVKVWQVKDVEDDGTAVFENMVESLDMRQKRTGRQEIRYNSETDKEPPPEFQTMPESVGVKISTIKLSPSGKVVYRKKEDMKAAAQNEQGEITIPFPEEPIAVGKSWSFPHDITVPLNSGTIKTVKTEQKFTLDEVKTGIATISVATVILTPINNPVIEAQLIQRQSSGTVRFDIDAGRVIGQQMDLDKRVVGFVGSQNPTSSIHYLTRFTEEFLSSETASAQEKTDTPDSRTASTDEKIDAPDSKTASTDEKTDDPGSETAEAEPAAKPAEKQSVAAKPDNSEVKK